MKAATDQHCDYCGEPMGVFTHSRRLDGPRVCGSRECQRDATNDDRAERDEAASRAADDDFNRYRGGGW